MGLRFPVFPGSEEVIPENETLIHVFSVIFTSENMRRYLAVFGWRKGSGNGFQAFPASFLEPYGLPDRIGEVHDFYVGET